MLNLEITNKCQLKCPACLRQIEKGSLKGTREHKFDTLKVIFDTFQHINFSGQISDPIYHKEFLQILDYLNPEWEYLISTNGHGKTKEWWTEAFELTKNKNIRWRFAVDGLPKDSHIYRIGQDGEQVWEMMKLGSKLGAKIEWQYIVFNYNENNIEEAKEMAKDNSIRFILTFSNRFGDGETSHLKPINEEYIAK